MVMPRSQVWAKDCCFRGIRAPGQGIRQVAESRELRRLPRKCAQILSPGSCGVGPADTPLWQMLQYYSILSFLHLRLRLSSPPPDSLTSPSARTHLQAPNRKKAPKVRSTTYVPCKCPLPSFPWLF
ncbi:hypothetical protein KC19_3G155000 [Ceratodon purpureus]|uniref:Uncharacterized protein n=1 Tax=Ceratodon purpureus TaxID=3225 RepID=A0A8T0ILG2_CERPU|nr:hypothetical protein KC19_3G155000 [Ceratodon purpureus]